MSWMPLLPRGTRWVSVRGMPLWENLPMWHHLFDGSFMLVASVSVCQCFQAKRCHVETYRKPHITEVLHLVHANKYLHFCTHIIIFCSISRLGTWRSDFCWIDTCFAWAGNGMSSPSSLGISCRGPNNWTFYFVLCAHTHTHTYTRAHTPSDPRWGGASYRVPATHSDGRTETT